MLEYIFIASSSKFEIGVCLKDLLELLLETRQNLVNNCWANEINHGGLRTNFGGPKKMGPLCDRTGRTPFRPALIFPHLLNTNYKSTYPCLIATQKRTLKWRTMTTSRSSRRHQPVICLWMKMLWKTSFKLSEKQFKTFVYIY